MMQARGKRISPRAFSSAMGWLAGISLLAALLIGCDENRGTAGQGNLADGDGVGVAAQDGEAPSGDHGLVAVDAYMRQPVPGHAMSAAFVTVRNDGDYHYTLRRVSSSRAKSVEIHRTTDNDGVMAMRPVDRLVVPPREEVEFKPGGYHLMLSGLEGQFSPGDTLPLHFSFEEGVTLDVMAEVR